MKNKRTGIPFYIFCVAILIGAGFLGYQLKDSDPVEVITEKLSGLEDQGIIDLIGSGDSYTGDICYYSTSSPATFFQFASSTIETWWTTGLNDYPNYYGATPTAAFLTDDADLITLNFVYNVRDDNIGGTLTCEFAVSNDNGCNQASSTLNTARWLPIPTTATSTSWIGKLVANTASTSITYTDSAIGEYEWSKTFEDVNYRCMQVKCYNSSTTADNLLHVEAKLK